jgi:hypothetical protein
MLLGSVALFFLAAILFTWSPLLAMAQQPQTGTLPPLPPTTTPSLTPIPPLTPEEQGEQTRLQNVIAATNQNLDEAEKEVNGVVYTPRWSNPVWIEADSLAVLVAYCLPGEFAESGQEILGGFELEVLESYEIALPQGFMAWMMVIGNEDRQDRLPAAVGVVCASDTNDVQTRVLSPQEQQQINNVISQFTQVTNIDQVINIINDVTTEPTTEGQPLRVEIIPNATTVFGAGFIKFDADVTGGTPPYSYAWRSYTEGSNRSFTQYFQVLGTHTILLNVTDSKNQTASDSVQITVKGGPPTNDTGGTTTEEQQPLTVEIIPNEISVFVGDQFELKTNVTGGTEPYSYEWDPRELFGYYCSYEALVENDASCIRIFTSEQPGTHEIAVTVRDNMGRTASAVIQITVKERPQEGGLLGEGVLDNATVAGEGRGGETSSREGGGGEVTTLEPTQEEPGGVAPPQPPTAPDEGEGDTTAGEEDSAATPPSDDTGGGGG